MTSRRDATAVRASDGDGRSLQRNPTTFPFALLLTACIALLAGCDNDNRHLAREVTAAEIVGTWKMTRASVELLERDGYTASRGETQTIVFNADGSMVFASVLDDLDDRTFLTCPGNWELRHGRSAHGGASRANVMEVRLRRANDTVGFSLSLADAGGTLRLWEPYGDPDSWEFLEYERQ